MSLTHGSKFSNTEPRRRDKPTKAERKLQTRIDAFESPLSKNASGHEQHRPGSQKIK